MKNETTVERKSEREVVITRTFNAPAHIVFEAWTKPELFRQWWLPKSMGVSVVCEGPTDVHMHRRPAPVLAVGSCRFDRS